ncbi:MAG: arylsulfatase [Bacillota bacterium]|nr:arylsulfatase [Bacillota bacterium]
MTDAERSDKPNIVFVLTDDQGYGDLGCTGNPIIKTPHIDRLYRESARLTDFHVGPTCAPTRASLLTGHWHNSTGVWHTIGGRSLLRQNETSLAAILQANGYRTGIFGKWHLGDNYPYRPHDRGFTEAIVHGGGGIGQTPDYWGNDYFDDTYFDCGEPRTFKGYCTDVFFRLGIDFIERSQHEPFFCFIPTNAPHSPLQIDDDHVAPYEGQVPAERARFYGMISSIDDNVSLLRARLSELGLTERTILIFMTDNGTATGCSVNSAGHVIEGYNAGMRGIKGSPYEGGHRVPFFLHAPALGMKTGRDIDELAGAVDFVPTILDLCGITVPDGLVFDGQSLLPALSGSNLGARALVTDSQRIPRPVKWKDSAVMRDKWRLIRGVELYDLDTDPAQLQDLAAAHPDRVSQMREDYEQWWDKVSERFDEEIPIIVGSEKEQDTDITSHDWRGDVGDCAWNQGEIRQGKICNSHVELSVARDGMYVFELRRWPREEDRALCEGIEGDTIDWYQGGRALHVQTAALKAGDFYDVKDVLPDAKFVSFICRLQSGPIHLQTWLTTADGHRLGAYYVYIRRLTD